VRVTMTRLGRDVGRHRFTFFHSVSEPTSGVPRNGHVCEYDVCGALRAVAAESTFDAERGGPKRVAEERSRW